MWSENLDRVNYDPATPDLVEGRIGNHLNLVWNDVEYDPALIGHMVDGFARVDCNLDELRAFERDQRA